ncbi:tetratricopeptide repeat protein [Alphaproteobacteria bacterium]|nr:tetratricopeptide repeat protein [Alphaproteobacteria bacterium]
MSFALRTCAFAGAVAVALTAGWVNPATAQNVPEAQRQALEAAFEELIKDPTNLDKTYAYAKQATAAGDYEAAITSYERLLLFNPDLPRVRAELGVLYYRLGSFSAAKGYFEAVLADEKTPPEVSNRVQGFLSKIDDSANPHRFGGSFTFAGRFQSKANYGPDGDVLVNNVPATPGEETAEDDDFNMFAVLSGRYAYDMGNDAGDFFAVEGTIYGSRQFKFSNLDIENVRLTAGPGFNVFPKDSGPVLIRPTVRLGYVRLNDEDYNFSVGAGLNVNWRAFDDASLFFNGFVEDREYFNTEDSPNAETQDGGAFRLTAGARHAIDPSTSIRGQIFVGNTHGSEGFESYDEVGLGFTVNARVPSPFEGSKDLEFAANPWNVSFSANYTHRVREEANPIISNKIRKDNDFRFNGTVAVPLDSGWSVFTTLGWQDHQSNLPNNEFDNFSATLGANVRL